MTGTGDLDPSFRRGGGEGIVEAPAAGDGRDAVHRAVGDRDRGGGAGCLSGGRCRWISACPAAFFS